MIRKIISLTFLLLLIWVANLTAQWTVPRLVVQEVLDYGSVYPDSLIYPENGTITFKAYIVSREKYALTEEHNSSHAHVDNGRFVIVFNLGNFPSLTDSPRDWRVGETIRIEVLHKPTGRVALAEFVIPEGSKGIFKTGKEAIILQEPESEDE